MKESPSPRLVDQRVRNRAIDALQILADGPNGVRAVGNVEYVNTFFDVVDDDMPGDWRDMSTYIPAEVAALEKVQSLLVDACAATPQICTDDVFIASGWPVRIAPVAATALATMLGRGRFREDREEESPSC
jgi:hypothetical protein